MGEQYSSREAGFDGTVFQGSTLTIDGNKAVVSKKATDPIFASAAGRFRGESG
jgi:hypothetical protein